MRKVIGLLTFFAMLSFLMGCALFENDLERAMNNLSEDNQDINKVELGIVLIFDEVSMNMNNVVLMDGDITQITMEVDMDSAGLTYSESDLSYYYEANGKHYLYSQDPLFENMYRIIEDNTDYPEEYDDGVGFLSDLSRFEEVEANTYYAEYQLDEIVGSMDNYIEEILSQFGDSEISSEAMSSNIGITIYLIEERLDYIKIDLSDVFSVLLSELFYEITGEETDIEAALIMTMRLSIEDDLNLELPTNVINLTISDDTPALALDLAVYGGVDYQYDQQSYKLVITESGLYHFDFTSDSQLLYIVYNVENPDDFIFENIYFSTIELNSRGLELSPGEYIICVLNNDPLGSQKVYSIEVSKLSISDDYGWDVSYDSQKEEDITSYGTIYLRNDFAGDIDTVYFPWFEMQTAILKVPKDLVLLTMQNADIYGHIETADYDYYVIRFKNPDSWQRYTWSLSFIHMGQTYSQAINIKSAYSDLDSSGKNIGTLTTTNELIISAFQSNYFVFNAPTSGDYQISFESTREDATFSIDIFTDTYFGNYIGSIGDWNNYTIHLSPGKYYFYPSSNWDSLAIFKITIAKVE